jgi:hypothetical protein
MSEAVISYEFQNYGKTPVKISFRGGHGDVMISYNFQWLEEDYF